ncbi:MAG: pyridine nucleotide-disulfide oxidoreductase [Betaproteobacteria bacterium HGW-Betaproteobacteria-14]|nr:MAG: pyridine nucleotide-disulfide oxidoreductase [Betaproteobacteria bacterium HGW-Betaproteobacteria-14]
MKRLLLAGAGHAHLHVLKALAAGRPRGVETILVTPHLRQMYSGMLPGWIAGHYALDECAVRLEPLARAAGVRLLQDSVAGLHAERRTVRCAEAGELGYDVLSIDTGARLDASSLAATGAALLPIRPLEAFVVAWERQVERFARAGRAALAVVGGGAAGVELALAIRHRLARLIGEDRTSVTLVAGGGLLAGHGATVVERAERALRAAGVGIVKCHAAGAPTGLQLADGREWAVDCVVAATGASPPGWLADSGLALDGRGFIAVGDGQRSLSHAEVFAAGDVATRQDAPHAKSGVYAVRAGPVLSVNLARALEGRPIVSYRPQRRSLYLLATGPKAAIVSWRGLTAAGKWAWRWKDRIDRRFLMQYDVAEKENHELAEGDRPAVRAGRH